MNLFVTLVLAVCVTKATAIIPGGGEMFTAKEGTIPYIAHIQLRHPHTGEFLPICAGAIISDQSILTNAVCATVCNVPSECKVFVGRVNIRSGGKELTIKGSVWHNSYIEMRMIRPRQDELINIHDIGIIHVEPIQLSESVQIISLPKQTLNGETPVRLAGWGNSLHMDVQHPTLQYGESTAILCKTEVVDSVCIGDGGLESGVRPCSDMGAPMVNTDTNELVGIGTFWAVRALQRENLVYSEVYIHLDWICSNMWNGTYCSKKISDEL